MLSLFCVANFANALITKLSSHQATDPSHTTIIEKIADLLHLVSSETELAWLFYHRLSNKFLHGVCGFGLREVYENITEHLDKAVLEAAEQGCIIFYTGAMGQFDSMFCSAVRKAKRSYPITLYYLRTKNTKLLILI